MPDIRQELANGTIIYHVDDSIRVYVAPKLDDSKHCIIEGFELQTHSIPSTISAEQAQGLAHALGIARKALQKSSAVWSGQPFINLLNHHRILNCWVPAQAAG